MINAERSALNSPEFKAKMMTTRKQQLEELLSKYILNSKNMNNISNFSFLYVEIHL